MSEDLISFIIAQPPSWQTPQVSNQRDKSPTLTSIAQSLQSTQLDKLTSQLLPPLMYQDAGPSTVQQVKNNIESEKNEEKLVVYLKQLIGLTLNGLNTDSCLMSVIRFVMPRKNKALKKLLHLYWEICPKYSISGTKKTLKHEMVLVVNALQHDLSSSNEYIRANTLRLIAKLQEQELLEPLVPHLRQCLEHRHPIVKKQAIITISKVYMLHSHLVPDAGDILFAILVGDSDAVIHRTVLNALFDIQPSILQDHLSNPLHLSKLLSSDENTLLLLIQILRKHKSIYPIFLKSIHSLLSSTYPSVQFEAAGTLITLTKSESIIKSCAETYLQLIRSSTDINVKLIVLNELYDLLNNFQIDGLSQFAVDCLSVLDSPDISVITKSLECCLLIVSIKSIDEVVLVLQKQLLNHQNQPLLLKTLQQLTLQFPSISKSVLNTLLQVLFQQQMPLSPIQSTPTTSASITVDILQFIQTILQQQPQMRAIVVDKLHSELNTISSGKVMRHVLWLMSEYSTDLSKSFELIIEQCQSTENAPTETLSIATHTNALYQIMQRGDFYTGSVAGSSLAKLAIKIDNEQSYCKAMLAIAQMLKLGGKTTILMDEDSFDYLHLQLQLLARIVNGEPELKELLLKDKQIPLQQGVKTIKPQKLMPWESLHFGILQSTQQIVNIVDVDLNSAIGNSVETPTSKLNKIVQLTGMSDPIYAECYVHVNLYDIVLDIILVNQSQKTLQNVSVEFSTLGDLKIIEKPQIINMGPNGYKTMKCNIKVSSTETGVIFGSIYFDGLQKNQSCLHLGEIHVDILDYIKPAECTDLEFRSNWTSYEWENKVNITTNLKDLQEYMKHLLKSTNMKCLTEVMDVQHDGVIAANLYAKSVFGEDALANVCIEQYGNGCVVGHVRIRAKTQGIALSLGDKISLTQKV